MADSSPAPAPTSSHALPSPGGPGTSTQPHQPPHPNNNQDIISVKNLQLPAGVVAPDVWGKAKEQPALLTVSLVLRGEGFGKAAEGDRLDASTIHYGELSKREFCPITVTGLEVWGVGGGDVDGVKGVGSVFEDGAERRWMSDRLGRPLAKT